VLRFCLQPPKLLLGVVERQQRARYAALRGGGGLVSGGDNVGVGVGVGSGAVVALAVLLVRVLALHLEHDVGVGRARAGVSVDCRGAALAAAATAGTLARRNELHKSHERDNFARKRHLSPVGDTLGVSQRLSCLS